MDPWGRIGLKNSTILKKHPFFDGIDFDLLQK
jgi:hypothetical protein